MIEFRDPSWFDDETADVLRAHGVASAISDAGRWPRFDAVTTDLAYVRLHGRPDTYRSAYGRDGLAEWAARARAWLEQGLDVHVCFDNTMRGAAPEDAATFGQLSTRAGPEPPCGPS